MLNINDNNIDNINKKIVIFYHDMCDVCHMLIKQFEDVSCVAKCNCMDNPHLAIRYNITSVPTVLVIDKGNVIEQLLPSAQVISDYIDRFNLQ